MASSKSFVTLCPVSLLVIRTGAYGKKLKSYSSLSRMSSILRLGCGIWSEVSSLFFVGRFSITKFSSSGIMISSFTRSDFVMTTMIPLPALMI